MDIKYNTKKYLKDNKLQKSRLARKIGMSKQLLQYHVNTERVSFIMINKIAQLLKTNREKVISDLNNNYIIE
jgi:hypothetical protein